jgi:hypothetical protein
MPRRRSRSRARRRCRCCLGKKFRTAPLDPEHDPAPHALRPRGWTVAAPAPLPCLTLGGNRLGRNRKDDRLRVVVFLTPTRRLAGQHIIFSGRYAAMSPYHFLRTFNVISGVTPYQFVLTQRLRRAAVRLRRTTDPISAIAYEAGFNDLSTFNRRFRRIMGMTPGAWRRRRP